MGLPIDLTGKTAFVAGVSSTGHHLRLLLQVADGCAFEFPLTGRRLLWLWLGDCQGSVRGRCDSRGGHLAARARHL